MGLNDRFYKRIIEHYEKDNPNMAKILSNIKGLDQAIDLMGANTIKSLSSIVGKEFGLKTREKVLKGIEGDTTQKIGYLMIDFKTHMKKRGINVDYVLHWKNKDFGKELEPGSIELMIDKCTFDVEKMPLHFCSYSKSFLEGYFNSEVETACTMDNNSNHCSFMIKL